MTDAFLDRQRLVGDAPADRLVHSLFESNSQAALYTALQLSENEVSRIKQTSPVITFLKSGLPRPLWFNANRILQGQKFFESYATEIMTLLGVLALPYCYAASPGNKALYLSTKMRSQPNKRLMDTAEFIIRISTKGNLTSGKIGQIQINKLRLTHAIARYHVAKSAWDKSWGVPINQEDMAGTNLAFSYLILVGLNRSGFIITDQQKEDFLFLWRYVGYLLGINEKLLPTSFKEAHQLAHLIKRRNFKQTEEGIILTRELLTYYRSAAPSNAVSFIDSQVRYFLGPEISEYLGLKPEYLKDRITGLMSKVNEAKNFLSIHKDSFGMMVANHGLMKKKFS